MSRREEKAFRREKSKYKHYLTQYTLNNDIRYRGPLKIIHMRSLGWLFMVVAQIAVALKIVQVAFPEVNNNVAQLIVNLLGDLSLPCFLIASFSYILQNKEKLPKLIRNYFIYTFLILLAFYAVYFSFGTLIYAKITMGTYEEAVIKFGEWLLAKFDTKLIFNVFLDLFLFSLFAYFMSAKPKKHFQGEKIKIFRAFALIPVIYESSFIICRTIAYYYGFKLPIFVYPFMPTKTPLIFITFIVLFLLTEKQRTRYKRQGGTESEYREFFLTKKNSWISAKVTALVFLGVGIADILLSIFSLYLVSGDAHSWLYSFFFNGLKLGESSQLLLLSPIILLFSFNKPHKSSNWDVIIPIIGICAMIVVYLVLILGLIVAIL